MSTQPSGSHSALHKLMRSREEELIALHQSMVRIPTINQGDGTSARENEAVAFMGDWLAERGIASRSVEGAPSRANLLAEWNAPAPGPSLLLMGHSDVVPPGDPAAWKYPPFSAERAEGRIWGRGSNDCKMLVACELFAAAILRESGLATSGTLKIAIGADEEAGGAWGFGWLGREHANFLRADLAINEGGGSYLSEDPSGAKTFLVCSGEKGRAEVVFTALGPGAHASTPWGRVNPLLQLAEVMRRIAAHEPTATPASPVFDLLARTQGADPASPDGLARIIEASAQTSRAFQNSLKAQSRITLVPTVLHSGEKSNALPARAELRCDARILPGQSFAEISTLAAQMIEGLDGIEFRVDVTAEPSVSTFERDVAARFERALGHTFGGTCAVAPTWCTGFTDSRFVRTVGTPTYGFQVVHPGADADRLSIHCIDESIEVGMLLPCAMALAHFALDFMNGD